MGITVYEVVVVLVYDHWSARKADEDMEVPGVRSKEEITYASSLAGLLAELQGAAAEETGAARAGVELKGRQDGGVGSRGGRDASGDGEEKSGDLGELHIGGGVWILLVKKVSEEVGEK